MDRASADDLASALSRAEADLFALPGVTGVGIGRDDDGAAIHVYVSRAVPAASVRAAGRLLNAVPHVFVGAEIPASTRRTGGTEHERSNC